MNSICVFDWNKVSQTFKSGLKQNTLVIRDGVAYWEKNSGRMGIAQIMPIKKIAIRSNPQITLENLIDNIYKKGSIDIDLPTTNFVGDIIIQTAYLPQQIQKLHKNLDQVAEDFNSLKSFVYMQKISLYMANIETVRSLLKNKKLAKETKTISNNLLAHLFLVRQEIYNLIDMLLHLIDKTPKAHLVQRVNFIIEILDLLPKAIYIEAQLCDRSEKFSLAEHLLKENRWQYQLMLEKFQSWFSHKLTRSNQFVELAKEETEVFDSIKRKILNLLTSPYNAVLLTQLGTPALDKG